MPANFLRNQWHVQSWEGLANPFVPLFPGNLRFPLLNRAHFTPVEINTVECKSLVKGRASVCQCFREWERVLISPAYITPHLKIPLFLWHMFALLVASHANLKTQGMVCRCSVCWLTMHRIYLGGNRKASWSSRFLQPLLDQCAQHRWKWKVLPVNLVTFVSVLCLERLGGGWGRGKSEILRSEEPVMYWTLLLWAEGQRYILSMRCKNFWEL